jgi:L-gulonolactone oxidase
MPIEVRWARADNLPLSMCFGRETASIAIHVRQNEPFEPYFVPVETIMRDYGGRPHWGKMHFQTAATLRDLYPEWQSFQKARKILDPNGRLANAYTDRVLGPIE